MRDRCSPEEQVCFQSKVRWTSAAKHLGQGTLPILIRELSKNHSEGELACTFLAELVELWFADQFDSSTHQRAWMKEHLWLQKASIREDPDPDFENWEEQFEKWEIGAIESKTYYVIRNLRAIRPLRLSRLVKVSDGRSLDDRYIRSYSICYYPDRELQVE
jgi:hypothetical protein